MRPKPYRAEKSKGVREFVDVGFLGSVLGGSWVVISRVISLLIWVISIVSLLISPLITTHEPPSRSRDGVLAFEPLKVWKGLRAGGSSASWIRSFSG